MVEMATQRCGALPGNDGSVLWRVWAPRAKTVELVLLNETSRRPIAMAAQDDGYFSHTEPNVPDGQRYVYRLDGGDDRPDPCSRWQPEGVAGPSAVVRTDRFAWTDRRWRGVRREELVFYELHVGTFTPEGTFDAIIPRLTALKDLGITAIELMPVGQFPGARNWGYDGVLPYAPQNTYGGPQGLARLVDACHALGLAIFLDVVYNHYGPEGNYLNEFGPYFTDHYKTPWGRAINYDDRGSEGVRHFVLENVRMWLQEFHLDGLRLDAVHAIYDLGARHILADTKAVAAEVADAAERIIEIVAESDLNDPRVLRSDEQGGYGLDAQWSDDFHHAVHAYLTKETRGYYSDFGSIAQLAQTFRRPFLYAGEFSPHRGRRHGAPPDGLSGDRFVVCIQNHDQVGNRAAGDRLSTLLKSPAELRLAASLLLLSPHLPLLFMGEEYGEERPFPFFCSFEGQELAQAVREGRAREFKDFVDAHHQVPDPIAQATFDSAKLSWSWPAGSPRAGLRQLYVDLIAARKTWPALRDFERRAARTLDEEGAVIEVTRGTGDDALRIVFNLTDRERRVTGGDSGRLVFSSESPRYAGGDGGARMLAPFECSVFGPASITPAGV